jgi:diguanylate cyclase (GGDEF)-like protein
LKQKSSAEKELSKKVQRLENTLGKFVAQVAENEEITKKIDNTEEAIYQTTTLEELLAIFVQQIKKNFDIPAIKVSLVEESKVAKKVIDLVSFEVLADYYSLITGDALKTLVKIDRIPILQDNNIKSFKELFSDKDFSEVKSLALVPFFSEDILAGVIGFGSYRKDYYNPQNDTRLLEKLGRRFSICLENVLKNERLKELSILDEMTGLLNVRGTKKVLKRKLEESGRFKQTLTLIYFDLDEFKIINDNFGHLVGDRAIQHFANFLKKTTREIDVLCRVGGDEFLAILPGTDRKKAEIYLERFKENLKNNLFECSNEEFIQIKFSFGITVVEGNKKNKAVEERNIDDLVKKADDEMRRHKKIKR